MNHPLQTSSRQPSRRSALRLAPLVLMLALPLAASAADLDLKIGPVNLAQGSVRVAVYDSSDNFRKTAVQQLAAAATVGTMTIKFSNLKPGDYAVAVYHDVNGNEKLDSNLLGLPKEPYGFSVVTGTLMGPPGWKDVKFALPESGAEQTIGMRE